MLIFSLPELTSSLEPFLGSILLPQLQSLVLLPSMDLLLFLSRLCASDSVLNLISRGLVRASMEPLMEISNPVSTFGLVVIPASYSVHTE